MTRVDLTKYACESGPFAVCKPTVDVDKEIPDESFEFDDMLGSASVEFTAWGERQRVLWTGLSSTGEAAFEGECQDSATGDQGRGLSREAEATGHVLGRRLSPQQDDGFTFMVLMAYAKTC